jgi:hypothetical protein
MLFSKGSLCIIYFVCKGDINTENEMNNLYVVVFSWVNYVTYWHLDFIWIYIVSILYSIPPFAKKKYVLTWVLCVHNIHASLYTDIGVIANKEATEPRVHNS